MTIRERPLPDGLTRYLSTPSAVEAAPARRKAGPADPGSAHHALESAFLRGSVYVGSGLVWLLVLGLVIRHVTR